MNLRVICSWTLALTLFFTLSSSARAAQKASIQPDGWNSGLKLPEPVDINPDPHILEVNLEARIATVDIAGKPVEVFTYNGGIPGPLLRLNVGDRLIVHFTNNLPDPTTVHWHGVRVPIEMDGVPEISQPETGTGQSFTYDFIVPDAGLFWYHPHVQSAAQVGFGLTGPLLVEDPADGVGVSDQLVLVLSDMEITEKGKLASADSGGNTAMAFGREGTVALVNGKQNAQISARAGALQRWRVVNTAKSQYFSLHLKDGGGIFTKIGGDGGLQEYSTKEEILTLAPGERADLLVAPKGKPGSEIQVVSELFSRGYGTVEFRWPSDLFRIALDKRPAVVTQALPKIHREIEPLKKENATPVAFDIGIIQHQNPLSFEYQVNGKPYWKAPAIPAKIGETQIWTVVNNTPWSHPLHLHGFFFQVLDDKGELVRPLQWKDTVNVPYKRTLRLLVRFDDRPGTWMVHCHILDHAEGGLMTTVQLGGGNEIKHKHAP